MRGAPFEQHVGLVEATVLRLLRGLHAQVPFAGDVGAVASIVQQFCQGGDIAAQDPFVTGAHLSAGRQALACFGHHAQPGQVRVVARHQHGAGRGAAWRGMEVQHQAAVVQQFVQVGCLDFAAQGRQVREAKVVSNNQQNVWLFNGWRGHGLACAEHEQAESGKMFEAVHEDALFVLIRVMAACP
ncbi:hypothetical protein D3C81_1303300 [compost metagenome]